LFDPRSWAQFQRRHAFYLTNANERQAARNLAGMDMIRAVEVYENNPMFDPLYKREHVRHIEIPTVNQSPPKSKCPTAHLSATCAT
jgi:hypothetical protein